MSDYLPEPITEAARKVVERLEAFKSVLPGGVIARQFLATVIGEMNGIADDKVSWQSAVTAVYNCAMVGLIPGKQLGHAYFIPRKRKLNLEIGYKGFLELAYACDFLAGVHPQCVLKDEEFEYGVTQDGPKLAHVPGWDDTVTRDNLVAAYVVYRTKNGWNGVKVVSRREIDRVDTQENVWASEYKAMVLKTPIRRAAKEWQQTARLGLAIQLDEQAERNEDQTTPVDVAVANGKPMSLKDIE